MVANRYKIKGLIGKGGMGEVYRATDRITGEDVAFKLVTVPTSQIDFSLQGAFSDARLALAQEFKTLASLRHPNIINVMHYGFDHEGHPYVTMQLLENAPTITHTAKNESLEVRVNLLIQLFQALAYLHRRSILHRDLKPDNVLTVGGQVKVLDFGLAMAREQVENNHIVGTLAYMAPEVLQGAVPTETADLYAAGVIAYELFSGHHPFDTGNVQQLISDVLSSEPDLTPLESLNLKSKPLPLPSTLQIAEFQFSPVASIVQKLLSKNPHDRFQNATEAITALSAAIGQSLPEESVAIRESFLQAAKFVGREMELEKLNQILDTAVAGEGSTWLIGGESGVGKSRLIEELRIQAMVKGILVLRGQAVSEGNAGYQLWRNIWQSLVLYANLTGDEASILKPYVSSITRILERAIPDPTPTDPQQAQILLIQALTAILSRLEHPALLIFEDLQWASTESLTLLERLAQITSHHPLLFIGNYRNDERPNLPEALPSYRIMPLRRMSRQGITQLSMSILGQAGGTQNVLDLLERETEGNAFFLVEVIRALAERAGRLDEITLRSLPEQIFAGGVQQIIEQRLSRLPEDARPLLELAAIAGRALDLNVLKILIQNGDLDNWLGQCTDAAVIEVTEGWQFTHDKIREQLLFGIPKDRKSLLYQQVAETIEMIYADDPGHAASLAHLWWGANRAEKELFYSVRAGEQALQNNANPEALEYFDRALELLNLLADEREPSIQDTLLHLMRSAAITFTAGYTHGGQEESLSEALNIGNKLKKQGEEVDTLLGIILASLSLYHIVRSVSHHKVIDTNKELHLLAEKTNDPIVKLLATGFSGWQFLYGHFSFALSNLEIAWKLYRPDTHQPLLFQLGIEVGNLVQIAFAVTKTLLGYPVAAREHDTLAFEIAETMDHYFTLGLSWSQFCILDSIVLNFEAAADKAQKSLDLGTRYNFPNFISHPLFILGYIRAQHGNPDAEAFDLMKQGLEVDQAIGTRIWRPLHLGQLAEAYLLAGSINEAQKTIDLALSEVEETGERFAEAELHRLHGELRLKNNEEKEAETALARAIEVAQEQGAKWWELRAAVSLAHLRRTQGKQEEAREMLSKIYGWFTEGFDTVDLRKAKALLEELS